MSSSLEHVRRDVLSKNGAESRKLISYSPLLPPSHELSKNTMGLVRLPDTVPSWIFFIGQETQLLVSQGPSKSLANKHHTLSGFLQGVAYESILTNDLTNLSSFSLGRFSVATFSRTCNEKSIQEHDASQGRSLASCKPSS